MKETVHDASLTMMFRLVSVRDVIAVWLMSPKRRVRMRTRSVMQRVKTDRIFKKS